VRLLAQAVVGNRKDWRWAQVEPPLFDARHVVLLGGRHEGHTLPDPPQHWSKGNGRPLMGYLETIFEAAERLGGDVDKQLKPARDLRARADELNRQPDQARSAEGNAYGELVEAIAAGRVPPGEAAKAAGTWIFDSQASKTIVAAVSVCHTEAAAVAREAGPRIFAALQRRVAGIVDESVKRSVELPRGSTARQRRCGPMATGKLSTLGSGCGRSSTSGPAAMSSHGRCNWRAGCLAQRIP
jgi:hypothetical protein